MQTHTTVAHEMLSAIPFLEPALDIPAFHHEWWNGQGYPNGLAGEEIPLAARIFAVVDVWDAVLSDRPYRSAWTHNQAIQYLSSQSGTQFDPHVVSLFLRIQSSRRNAKRVTGRITARIEEPASVIPVEPASEHTDDERIPWVKHQRLTGRMADPVMRAVP